MTANIIPSHVAVLVPSVVKAADHLAKFNFNIGKEEVWEGEGTKEIYVTGSGDLNNSLLLMEPIKVGAYQRALEKRGPGLHHLAVDVLSVHDFVESLVGTGWLLHPASLKTLVKTKTIYLARPRFPGLIEVQERKELVTRPLFVNTVSIPLEPRLNGLLKHVGLTDVVRSTTGDVAFSLNDKMIKLADLL